MSTQVLIPEKIKPGLQVQVNWYGDGRLLMDNKEDTQYGLSKEHVDYFNSMTMETK